MPRPQKNPGEESPDTIGQDAVRASPQAREARVKACRRLVSQKTNHRESRATSVDRLRGQGEKVR
jgi:hypothetical protein